MQIIDFFFLMLFSAGNCKLNWTCTSYASPKIFQRIQNAFLTRRIQRRLSSTELIQTVKCISFHFISLIHNFFPIVIPPSFIQIHILQIFNSVKDLSHSILFRVFEPVESVWISFESFESDVKGYKFMNAIKFLNSIPLPFVNRFY